MDPKVLSLKDAALIVLAAATQAANILSPTFDLAQGQTIQNSQFAPGAGGAALNMIIPVTSYNAAVTFTLSGAPTGGTFNISLGTVAGGTQTATVAFNANAAAIQTALAALTNIGAGNVTVTGGGPFTITYSANLGIVTTTGSITGLTGGAPVITAVVPTYSFVINESIDGANWQAASRVATLVTDPMNPLGDVLQIEFTAKWRYIQLSLTVGGTAPSIVLGDSYITPFVNRFG